VDEEGAVNWRQGKLPRTTTVTNNIISKSVLLWIYPVLLVVTICVYCC
jgi:hypothetical protein